MDVVLEIVMNIIDEEYFMGIEIKRVGIGYDFYESLGVLELLCVDRWWCYFKLWFWLFYNILFVMSYFYCVLKNIF